MSDEHCDSGRDELRQAADDLMRAAQKVGDRIGDRLVGREANGHLRQATRHSLRAVRALLERAESELERQESRLDPEADEGASEPR